MIQRKQTIWLLLAALCAFLITRIPLYVGKLVGEVINEFSATESLLLFALAIVMALLGLINIFLFKNRPLQFRLSLLGLLLSAVFIALEVWQIDVFKEDNGLLAGSYYWGALLPIATGIFFMLAAIYIKKDEKLIKSADRFR